ncbi:P-loop containing nucleoside triphosphate hydrolase protein [Mycena maculata]|uniref:P-loop containing nucleoside triphosphate hydrolase protein n=1 Tax=Mycena maculata TaxID=230809 RepID=A0AAD7I6I6_9AGAR|nr:P-loop containing nucleoside triphosphate hydrolase protein [Mycena maculata]
MPPGAFQLSGAATRLGVINDNGVTRLDFWVVDQRKDGGGGGWTKDGAEAGPHIIGIVQASPEPSISSTSSELTLATYFSLAGQILSALPGSSDVTAQSTAQNSTVTDGLASVTDFSSLVALLVSAGALWNWLKVITIGLLVEALRRATLYLYSRIPASFWITAHFHEDDDSYEWMMVWLSKQPSWAKARDIEVSTDTFGLSTTATLVPGEETDNNLSLVSSRKLAYLPAASRTYPIWYHGRYMLITRVQENTGWRGRKQTTLEISILTRNNRVLNELLLEAKKDYMAAAHDTVSIYVADSDNDWVHAASRPKRKLNSIILDPGITELLVDDARDFLNSRAWYTARGIPFRRGYLLYGAPGSGKTSIISSIAGELGLDIYIVSLSRTGLDDAALSTLISDLPEKCISLIEDIDATFTHNLNRDDDPGPVDMNAPPGTDDRRPPPPDTPVKPPVGSLSLGGLLNALDGIAAQEGRLLYATTNKYSALDPALCRPGRMDVHVEFRLASKDQARKLFFSFYLPADEAAAPEDEKDQESESSPAKTADVATSEKPVFFGTSHRQRAPKLRRTQVADLATRFAEAIPERELSMAALQGFLMMHKSRPFEAVSVAGRWVETEREVRAKKAEQS